LYGAFTDPDSSLFSFASGTLGLRIRRGGGGRSTQGGINDYAPAHRHSPRADAGVDDLKKDLFYAVVDWLAYPMLPNHVAKSQNCGLIRHSITDQLDASEMTQVGHLDQYSF
jgi:hypothetical protein